MIYLDNSATTIDKPPGVMEAMASFRGNPGRGGHELALDGARTVFECRERLCDLFNTPSPEKIIFTKNGTEALNLAISGSINPSDHVVITSMEHNSVIRPIVENHLRYTIVKADEKGFINPKDTIKAFQKDTKLMVVAHASNVCGSVQNIEELARIAHLKGCRILVDAAQTAGIIPFDLAETEADFVAFSGHKGMMGPLGTGVLIMRDEILLKPLTYGGTGSVSETSSQPRFLPDRYESGTLNGCGIAGLLVSTKFLLKEGVESINNKKTFLVQRLIDGLLSVPDLIFYGSTNATKRADAVSFNIRNRDCNWVSERLEQEFGIYGRSGLQCAPLAHKTIGSYSVGGTVRLSPSYFTEAEEIDKALNALLKISRE